MFNLSRCLTLLMRILFLVGSSVGILFFLLTIKIQKDNAELDYRSVIKRQQQNNFSTSVTKDGGMNQDDPRLISKIRNEYLNLPSPEPYNLSSDEEDPSLWQAQFVKELLQQKKNGFFVDAGANQGEWISNTLAFERLDVWEGILIEAIPEYFQMLQSKHRKAYTVPACLSDKKYSKTMEFQKLGPRSRLTSMGKETNEVVEVQCFPIYSILLAVGRTKIDYFSLDVEGSELKVLKTIPWDKVEITAISVEYENIMHKKKELRSFMEEKGYSWIDHPSEAVMAYDYIFYRQDLLETKRKQRNI